MAGGTTGESRRGWVFPVIGAVVGVALGIVVAVTTNIPPAPEIGLVVGLAAGWGVSLMRN
jgi:cobalamin synthase